MDKSRGLQTENAISVKWKTNRRVRTDKKQMFKQGKDNHEET